MPFFKDRPWIWLIVLALFMLSGSVAILVFSNRLKQDSLPIDTTLTPHH